MLSGFTNLSFLRLDEKKDKTATEVSNETLEEYLDRFDIYIDKKCYAFGDRTSARAKKIAYSDMSDYWKTVHDAVGVDRKVYVKDFDVDSLITKLKTSKILDVQFLLNRPTIKWLLTLDGGQKIVFKPDLNVSDTRLCKAGCEHPAYEVIGFAINRMLGLNNMPFTTMREIDWFRDIQPVARKNFTNEFIVYNSSESDRKVCVKWTCRRKRPSLYCFLKGRVLGSVMYWVTGDILELLHFSTFKRSYSRQHLMYFSSRNSLRREQEFTTGDSRFCEKFRRKPPYNNDYNFLYILDMAVQDFLTQSKNSKHNVMYLDNSNTDYINLDIDKGKGFCSYDDDLLLAPIYQCCKIRKTVYETLVNLKDRFVEQFREITHLENFDSLIQLQQLEAIQSRVQVILVYVEKCFDLKGKDNVLIGD